jgi:phosphoglycolate phosphatase
MPIRALLFDFDGTLADSFAAITASTNHTRQTYGLAMLTEAEVRSHVGHGLKHLMTILAPSAPSADEAVNVYRDHHETVAIPMTQLLPGVRETIHALRQRGFPLAVCSNKTVHFTKRLVAHLFPNGEFTEVLGPDDVGIPKPHPAMLIEACRRLNVPVSESIYVGDMHVDVETAKATGMPCWLVEGGAGGSDSWQKALAAKPDKVLKQFDEIKSLV